jgi:hypothetical protein
MNFAKAIVSSFQNAYNTVSTENGATICEDTGHSGVTAFHKLVRDHTRNFKTGKHLLTKSHMSSRNRYPRTGTDTQPDTEQQEPQKTKKYTMPLETSESSQQVAELYGKMITDAIAHVNENRNNTELLNDAFILPFYKRCFTKTVKVDRPDSTSTDEEQTETHTGEGERLLFYQMILELHKQFPETVYKLVKEIPKYGYWGDLFSIWQLARMREVESPALLGTFDKLKLHILLAVMNQLSTDIYNKSEKTSVSLLAKWIPREGSAKDRISFIMFDTGKGAPIKYTVYTALAILYSHPMNFAADTEGYLQHITERLSTLYTSEKLGVFRMKFRKMLSSLNKHINTFEIAACDGKWSTVDPKSMPSRAMLKYNTAYLNEKKNTQMTAAEEVTGNRYPDNPDRVAARDKLIQHILSNAGIKVSGIDPHEIMNAYRNATSSSQKLIALKQWESKLDEVFETFVETEGLDKTNPESLKKSRMCAIVPMMDVSGSMAGLPMEVSIGLGLFICGLQRRCGVPEIAIAFHEKPFAFNFTGMTLGEQINTVYKNVGMTTNFESAINLLLDAIKTSGEHKDLIVFTDGQFDAMNTASDYSSSRYTTQHVNWTTCHTRIMQKVAAMGLEKIPNIIYWNLRANTPGVQTSAHHPGVQMLQGYSPAILKFALYGDDCETTTEMEVTMEDGTSHTVTVNTKTPYETYRQALDQPCFDSIRRIMSESNEGVLSYM